MDLHPKQRQWLERLFPGLVDGILALGPGDWEPKLPKLKPDGADCVSVVRVGAEFKLTDGYTVDIRTSSRLKTGAPRYKPDDAPVDLQNWERFHYALHYGKTYADCVFRIDLDDNSGHHVHFRERKEDQHVPAEDVLPDTKNMDPRDFVKMVEKYRKDGSYPLRRKTP